MNGRKMNIIIKDESTKRGRVLVNLLVDGKKKSWNMSKGLWEFVKRLIKDQALNE